MPLAPDADWWKLGLVFSGDQIIVALQFVSQAGLRVTLISFHYISAYKHSLEIIKAANIQLDGKKAAFYYRGKSFKYVSVTDPDYKGIEQTLEEAYLVISIPTDDYDGYGYFKFIAAIYPIEKKPWGKEEDEDLHTSIEKRGRLN